MPVQDLNTQNISQLKMLCTENNGEWVCNGVDTCFLIIPNGIVKVLKTLQQRWITWSNPQGSISYSAMWIVTHMNVTQKSFM